MLICSEASMFKKIAWDFYFYVPLIFLALFIANGGISRKDFVFHSPIPLLNI